MAEPNTPAIVSIITACAAAIPPTVTTITDIAIKLRGVLQKKKSPHLKVLKIIREPADIKHWRKVRRNFLIGIFLLVMGILFILTNTLLYRFGFKYITLSEFGVIGTFLGLKINIIVVINFLLFCFYLVSFKNAYKRLGNNPKDARYFLFKKAVLLVESDFQSTINRCQDTLKLLGARVLEFDSEASTIEVHTNNELASVFGGLYRIRIKTEDTNSVETGLEVEFLPYASDEISRLKKSSNVNRFIRVFIDG
jgi:hypothetical protein